jgi:predicted GNAT family acetyltransferase
MRASEKLIVLRTKIDGQEAARLMLVTKAWEAKGVATLTLFERVGMVSGLFTASRYRRKGVAGKLIAECGRIARRHKCETLSLIVVKDNDDARAAYKRLGFFTTYRFDDGDDLMSIRL